MLLGFGVLNCNRIIKCELISRSNKMGLFCETAINSVLLLTEGSWTPLLLPFYANAKGLASSFAHSGCAGRTSHVYVQELLLHAILPSSASHASMLLCLTSCTLTVPHVPDAATLASVFATHARLVLTSLVRLIWPPASWQLQTYFAPYSFFECIQCRWERFFFFRVTKSGAPIKCKFASKALFSIEKLPSYGRLRTASKSRHGRYELLATFHTEKAHDSMALRSSCIPSLRSVSCDAFQLDRSIVQIWVQAEEPYRSSCHIPPS